MSSAYPYPPALIISPDAKAVNLSPVAVGVPPAVPVAFSVMRPVVVPAFAAKMTASDPENELARKSSRESKTSVVAPALTTTRKFIELDPITIGSVVEQ